MYPMSEWACQRDEPQHVVLAQLGVQPFNTARDELWKLIAATLPVPDAQYEVTSVLDFAPERMPLAMAMTISELDLESIAVSARRLAAHLAETSRRSPATAQADFPAAMLDFVTSDLSTLSLGSTRPDSQL
jgi:hypothetical protein